MGLLTATWAFWHPAQGALASKFYKQIQSEWDRIRALDSHGLHDHCIKCKFAKRSLATFATVGRFPNQRADLATDSAADRAAACSERGWDKVLNRWEIWGWKGAIFMSSVILLHLVLFWNATRHCHQYLCTWLNKVVFDWTAGTWKTSFFINYVAVIFTSPHMVAVSVSLFHSFKKSDEYVI